jgi:DNA-directed RNA polymerase subunit beta
MKDLATYPKKYFGKFKKPLVPVPNLVKDQVDSWEAFIKTGLKEVFNEFSQINDFTGKKFQFEFTDFKLESPRFDEYYAKEKKLSYDAPLKVMVKLTNKIVGSVKEQEIFMADLPVMTNHGTFIVGGIERVIVPQLARTFGVNFTSLDLKGQTLFGAKIIPSRGAWIEIETDLDKAMYVRIDRKRKFPVTSLLRVFGAHKDEQILELFKDNLAAKEYLERTLAKDHAKTVDEAWIEIHKRLRDGDLATAENAKEFIEGLFNKERYDLSKVGRFRFNHRFDKPLTPKELERKTLSLEDLQLIVNHIITLNVTPGSKADDIDHLASRRVRYVGEMFQQKIRFGMAQIKRNIQNRMSTIETDVTLPINFISPKPLQARIKEFFATNQLSQFMGQENVLAEIEHLRLVSALGPGGLSRTRAGFEVRDIHPSHYGRLCPIHTPEGPNIGLILHLAVYARINEFGVIESPYAKVENGKVTSQIQYFNALEEEEYNIAHAATPVDKDGNITVDMAEVRYRGKPSLVAKKNVHYIDTLPTRPSLSPPR